MKLDQLELDGLTIRLDSDTYGPASMYDPTVLALCALGEHAMGGCIDTTFHLDGVSHERVGPGARGLAAGRARHHR